MVVEDRLARVEGILEEMRTQINSRLESLDMRMGSLETRMLRLEDRIWWLVGGIFTAWVTIILTIVTTVAFSD